MKLTAPITLAIALALCGPLAAAQLGWGDDACTHKVTFDPKKVDAAALKDTIDLLFEQLPVVSVGMFLTPEQAAQADAGKLQRECADVLEKQRRLKPLPLPGIEDYKAILIGDVRDRCDLDLAQIRAITDASALREYKPAPPACSEYVDALDGTADFERTWRNTIELSCRNNASPDKCRARDIAEGQKPDGVLRKRLLVLNYGWNNCAREHMTTPTLERKRNVLRDDLIKKFKRQFKVASKCENPG